MLKRIVSLLIIISMLMPAFPAEGDPGRVPEGYDGHDYNALAAFLELKDTDGVQNGAKLNEEFSLAEPETWTGAVWTEEAPKRLLSFTANWKGLAGELDLSGCDALERVSVPGNALTSLRLNGCGLLLYLLCGNNELDSLVISDCPSLKYLYCFNNRLTELDFSDSPGLDTLNCAGNRLTAVATGGLAELLTLDCARNLLTELDVSGSPLLYYIDCGENLLTELELSGIDALNTLYCAGNLLDDIDLSVCGDTLRTFDLRGNRFRSIDMSGCRFIWFDRLFSVGNGYVGISSDDGGQTYTLEAVPMNGHSFKRWYNASDDSPISRETSFYCSAEWLEHANIDREVYGRFIEDSEIGDADGDGELTLNDALLVLRCAMGLIELDEDALDICDADGDGDVTVDDALIILRVVMGIGKTVRS